MRKAILVAVAMAAAACSNSTRHGNGGGRGRPRGGGARGAAPGGDPAPAPPSADAARHQIALSVDGDTIDGNGNPQGPLSSSGSQPLSVSHDDATGALFYFATTGDQVSGDGTLERLELGAQKPDKYLNKTNDGGK